MVKLNNSDEYESLGVIKLTKEHFPKAFAAKVEEYYQKIGDREMDKIRIRQNYENYERVQKAFKEFIHALVWESIDIDAGAHEDEVNEHIDKYCRTNGSQMIALANDSVTKFIKSLNSRFEVHCYEIDANGNAIVETGKHFNTDNGVIAFKKAAEFYRHAKCPQVNIFDNELGKYVAEWD